MRTYRIVLDTNIIVAALRSQRGTSYALLTQIHRPEIEIAVSVPLVLEYEKVALAQQEHLSFSREDILAYIDYLCSIAIRQKVHYLWRPCLRDPADDMVLELAVAAQCDYIITFNTKDFAGSEQFGIFAITPKDLFTILAKRR
jgi:putative PIN family toxin of toxin-antitoxin system